MLMICHWFFIIRVRVIRERLSATPGHVIGQGPAPGEALFPAAAAAAAVAGNALSFDIMDLSGLLGL